MFSWKHVVAGFCIPINVIFIIFGIIIGDPISIALGLFSTALVSTPLIQDYHVKKNEKKKQEDDK